MLATNVSDGSTFNWTGGATEWNLPYDRQDTEEGQYASSAYAWNLGKYAIKDPLSTTRCYIDRGGNTIASKCSSYVLTSGYNEHYLIGNYYQWIAATAGTGSKSSSGDATASICPAGGATGNQEGWKLPANTSSSGSFGYLANQYSSNITTLASLPISFIRAGYIDLSEDYDGLEGFNSSGRYWTRASAGNDSAYNFGLSPWSTDSNNANSQTYANSIRCLYLGS